MLCIAFWSLALIMGPLVAAVPCQLPGTNTSALDSKFFYNCWDDEGNTRLVAAAARSNLTALNALLRLQPALDVDMPDARGLTALHVAASNGFVDGVRALLDAGAETGLPGGGEQQTAAMMAVVAGHGEALEAIVNRRSDPEDVNALDKRGRSLVTLAVHAGPGGLAMLETLLAADGLDPGAQTDRRDDLCSQTSCEFESPLTEAARRGDLRALRAILNHPRSDVNERRKFGPTPLLAAVAAGRPDVIKLLLAEDGIDANMVGNDYGWLSIAPLTKAVKDGRLDIVNILLAHKGVDVNGVSEQSTALEKAIATNHVRIFERLLSHPQIDVNLGGWYPPLSHAIANDNVEAARILLARKDLNLTIAGRSAFLDCLERQFLDIAYRIMLRSDVEARYPEDHWDAELNKTMVMAAIELGGDIRIVRLLLDKPGTDLNAADSEGRTALMYATSRNRLDVLDLLWQRTENRTKNAVDNDGRSLLFHAVDNSNETVCAWLLERPDLNGSSVDKNKRNLLMGAVKSGRRVGVVKLVAASKVTGFDLNAARDSDGMSALLLLRRDAVD